MQEQSDAHHIQKDVYDRRFPGRDEGLVVFITYPYQNNYEDREKILGEKTWLWPGG